MSTAQWLVTTGTLLLSFLALPNALASSSVPELELLSIQAQTARELDRFNSLTARSYLDCFCQTEKGSPQFSSRAQAICEKREAPEVLNQPKINTKGQSFNPQTSCTTAIAELKDQVLKAHRQNRIRLALIQGNQYLYQSAYSMGIEMPRNFRSQPELVVNHQIRPFVQLPAPYQELESLQDDEVQQAVELFAKEADRIRSKFVDSSDFQISFGKLGLDPAQVIAYLRGDDKDFRATFQQVLRQKDPLQNQKAGLNELGSIYAEYARNERRRWLAEHLKKLNRDLNTTPFTLYLTRAKPTTDDLLTALLQVEKNAAERFSRADQDQQKFTKAIAHPDAKPSDLINEFAYLLDHSLAAEYVTGIAVGAKGWTQADAEGALASLVRLRSRQVRNAQYTEMAATFGMIGLCFVPIPHLKALGLAVIAVKTNACTIVVGVATNTYFVMGSQSKHQIFLNDLMSTPDGWNQLVKVNQVIEQDAETRMYLLFNLLEVVPAYQILRVLRPIR